MAHHDGFWKLQHLSDAQLLESLGSVLCAQQRTLAELVAHLGEVEDRRLHLEAAHTSMFAYCVSHLGMSEDEACRRIELARLARKFPALFVELASGQITLSVALVLKPVLSSSNQLELLAAARGKNIRQARELVAEHFPKPDAPSRIRKLPEQRHEQASDPLATCTPPSSTAGRSLPLLTEAALANPAATSPLTASPIPWLTAASQGPAPGSGPSSAPVSAPAAGPSPAPVSAPAAGPSPAASSPAAFALASPQSVPALSPAVESQPRPVAPRTGSAPPVSRGSIEPLSAGRYRIQFTADATLKQQLERARDLLRHAHPTGDFAPIVSRALELLIDDLLRRRFGGKRGKAVTLAAPKERSAPSPAPEVSATPLPSPATAASAAPAARRAPIPRAARRAVLAHDGLGCSWLAPSGVRCGSQAWLEFDHRHPAGKGGSTEPENLRLLCRAHNQLAAEHAYGRRYIAQAARRRKKKPHSAGPPA